jgi:hypothetical protein
VLAQRCLQGIYISAAGCGMQPAIGWWQLSFGLPAAASPAAAAAAAADGATTAAAAVGGALLQPLSFCNAASSS